MHAYIYFISLYCTHYMYAHNTYRFYACVLFETFHLIAHVCVMQGNFFSNFKTCTYESFFSVNIFYIY